MRYPVKIMNSTNHNASSTAKIGKLENVLNDGEEKKSQTAEHHSVSTLRVANQVGDHKDAVSNHLRVVMRDHHVASQSDRCIDEEREAVLKDNEGRAGTTGLDENGQFGLVGRLVAGETILVGDCHSRTSLIKRIGGGSFGEIFLGKLVESDQPVAVKVEPQNAVVQFILNEGNIYRKLEGVPGIPRVHWYGLHGSEYAMMVMELMGSTLYEHWVNCGSKFSLKTVLMLIDQMLLIIQRLHENCIVHRDISVSNFMTGCGSDGLRQINLIDFGHAKKLVSSGRIVLGSRRLVLLPKPMVGTPRFASVFCHMGQEEGYRDDLESLAYVWIYLYKGRLPWQGQRLGPGESKLDRIAHMKLNTRLETLCEDLPEEFLVYMNYVRRLAPNQMPPHEQLRELFRNLAKNMKIDYDWQFDWVAGEKCKNSENCYNQIES